MSDANPTTEAPKPFPELNREPIVTAHSVDTPTGRLEYTATTGMLPIRGKSGDPEAGMFYMAYQTDGAAEDRPLMFSFNGGPGSSSVWLHLGCVGPRRVPMLPDGNLPPPPYRVVENPTTWLRHCDLVFIDPVGTGFSRGLKPEWNDQFWGLDGDLSSVAEFIRLYLTRNQRWSSPIYLVGESYGTTRAAGLSNRLLEMGVALSGIVLISSILNFQTARFGRGNDLPYILFLPTYAATAHYHGRVRANDRTAFLSEVKKWAEGEYATALMLGDRLPAHRKLQLARRLAAYTGLRPDYVLQADLRVPIHHFCKELLRADGKTVGRLDSRICGRDADGLGATPDYDPSMTAIRPPYTAALNDYLRRDLGYHTDLPYHILGGEKKLWEVWNWGSAGDGHPDTSEALRSAFVKNPHMRVFVGSGYYDLATPFFATEYTLAHLSLPPELRQRIVTEEYEAGHMMYIHDGSLEKLQNDIERFLAG